MARQPIPAPTFDLEALRAIIATPEARELLTQLMKDTRAKDRTLDMDSLCVKAFKRAGIENVRPREDVLTYNRWIEAGRRVRPGEASVKVKNLRLFHVSQTDPISEKEKAEFLAQKEARTADKLPKVTPISAAKAKKAAHPQPQPAV
jgi:hypothetical protein